MFVKVHDTQTVSYINLSQVVRVYNSIEMTHVMVEMSNGKHYRVISGYSNVEGWLQNEIIQTKQSGDQRGGLADVRGATLVDLSNIARIILEP